MGSENHAQSTEMLREVSRLRSEKVVQKETKITDLHTYRQRGEGELWQLASHEHQHEVGEGAISTIASGAIIGGTAPPRQRWVGGRPRHVRPVRSAESRVEESVGRAVPPLPGGKCLLARRREAGRRGAYCHPPFLRRQMPAEEELEAWPCSGL